MSILTDFNQIAVWIKALRGYKKSQRDPFRLQASRILEAFAAHDITPTQMVRLMPDGILKNPSVLASADSLKDHLPLALVEWVAETLRLNPQWLDGRSAVAHEVLGGYKDSSALYRIIDELCSGERGLGRLSIHVFKEGDQPLSACADGRFVAVLEEYFEELNGQDICRYYFLTEGEGFDHRPCVLHLMAICAIAHHFYIPVWGRVMGKRQLNRLYAGEGLIPALWGSRVAQSWYPDDALWLGLSGNQVWNHRVQADLREKLISEGMGWLAEKMDSERARLGGKRGAIAMLPTE